MKYKLKLNTIISLDGDADRKLIRHIEDLKASHRLGAWITTCLKACWENPEVFEEKKAVSHAPHAGLIPLKRDGSVAPGNESDGLWDMALKVCLLEKISEVLGMDAGSENLLMELITQQRRHQKKSSTDDIKRNYKESYDGVIRQVKRDAGSVDVNPVTAAERRHESTEKFPKSESLLKPSSVSDDKDISNYSNKADEANWEALASFIGESL